MTFITKAAAALLGSGLGLFVPCTWAQQPAPVTAAAAAPISLQAALARETLEETKGTLQDRGQAAVVATEDYVQANPHADECVGKIENMGAYPTPVTTEEGRIVLRLQFVCTFGD